MTCCSATLKALPSAPRVAGSMRLPTLPQWHIFMCRARWIVTPQASDAGSMPPAAETGGWAGAAKSCFWLVVAIGTGLLIAGLSG